SGLEHHLARAEVADDQVRHRAALGDRYAKHGLLRNLAGLADRVRHFVGLAESDADLPLGIADRDDGVEREAPATLHDLGAAIHLNHALREFRLGCIRRTTTIALHGSGHGILLEVETGGACAIGERLHAPVVDVTAAVEADLRDA